MHIITKVHKIIYMYVPSYTYVYAQCMYRIEGNFRVVQIFCVFRGQRSNTKTKTGINSHALVISHAKLLVGVVSWH